MKTPGTFLPDLLTVIRKAGEEILKYYDQDFSVEEKDDSSPVTEADLASERVLLEHLEGTGPGIISEETGLIPGNENGSYWIVDPLDGTQDFIDKTDDFSVMVGLLVDGKPELGVVYAPAWNKLWYAQKDKGSYLLDDDGDRKEIGVSGKRSLSDYDLIASRNHFSSTDKAVARDLGVAKVVRMGSLGIKFCTIAEGKADLSFYSTLRLGVWDCCAPHLILEEAGGEVTDLMGNQPEYDLETRKMARGILGIGGHNLQEIVEVINRHLDKLGDPDTDPSV